MYIVKYSALVHMAETHSQARVSFAICRVSTVREKVREKIFFQGQGIVREF